MYQSIKISKMKIDIKNKNKLKIKTCNRLINDAYINYM